MNCNPTPSTALDYRRATIAFLLAGLSCSVSLANWEARPLEVHEWGVNTFDWNKDQPLQQDLPDYFYPAPPFGGTHSEAEVGIEMRFAEGYANAWWPQVTRYRPLEVSARAAPPDWDAWKTAMLSLHEKSLLANRRKNP